MKNLNFFVMNHIGKRIRMIREAKSLLQEYMAEELGISQASYARFENQTTRITVERLNEIARILDTDIGVLLGLKELEINVKKK